MMKLRLSGTKARLYGPRLAITEVIGTAQATAITVTDYLHQRVFQRIGSSRTIPVMGTYEGSASIIQARVVDYITANEVVPWTTIQTNPSAGAFSGALTVPAGPEWYRLQVRDGVNHAIMAAGANKFAIGDLVALLGQSNMHFIAAASNASKYPLGHRSTVSFTAGAWKRIGNINDSYPVLTEFGTYSSSTSEGPKSDAIVHFAYRTHVGLGVVVGVLEYAVTGSSIASWHPTTGANYATFISALNAAGGDCATVIWLQGENGAVAGYQANLQNICNALRTHTGRGNDLNFGVVVLGPGTTYTAEGNLGAIRAADLSFIAANAGTGVYMAAVATDMDLAGDTIHFSNPASQTRMGKRYAKGMVAQVTGAGFGAQGPRITGATRSGATITVNVQHNGGTALADGAGGNGSALLGFRVYDNGVAATFSSTAIVGNTIVLTLSAVPTGPVTMDYAMANAPFGGTTSPASVVYDNDTVPGDTLGLPLQPCAVITVS